MSRLTDLIARARAKDGALGEELEKEFKALSSRRAFGLNFERHKPENVELPGRPVRKGDKVRILPPRGSSKKGDQTLWKVLKISKSENVRIAELEQIDVENPQISEVAVDDLVVVAEFRDYIYPGLVSTGKVERGGDKPYHTVINGENFHVLEALTYTHRGKVDAVYIDPPYNSGAKDWKYNNDYVESEDLYRHSKWLAFIERRILIARELMNPSKSVLIVAIDAREYLRLGLLLEQIFPEAKVQMISSVINPKGVSDTGGFRRCDEYIFVVMLGQSSPERLPLSDEWSASALISGKHYTKTKTKREDENEVNRKAPSWTSMMRRGTNSLRKDRPLMFYPIYADPETKRIVEIGETIPDGEHSAPQREGLVTILPIRSNGDEGYWQISAPELKKRMEQGRVKLGKPTSYGFVVNYLPDGAYNEVMSDKFTIVGRADDGSLIAYSDDADKYSIAPTQWKIASHNSSEHGSSLLEKIIPGRKFPFPKSLYAVEDVLRFFIKNNSAAVVLDFFGGSGTSVHAVMRLNKQDGGSRQCICVTNNEVSAEEQFSLKKKKLRPGDDDWEQWGICEYITKPRIQAAITGKTLEGKSIEGDYKFTDEFPMADGFEENAEFFTLTYETPVAVRHNVAFKRVAPLLWMRAGSQGSRIEKIPEQGWDVVEAYGVLVNLDQSTKFCKAIKARERVRIAYIVTDDDRRFQAVARHLPDVVEPVRLYESYLSNFRFSMGR